MKKEEIMLGGHRARIVTGTPAERKRNDKLNSMRIALTYIESQGMVKVTPKKAIEIADEFLKWLRK